MRLLLAGDERSPSNAPKTILEGNHYSVDAVYDGVDALACLDDGSCGAPILGIMMPKLDGLSVFRRLRAAGTQSPRPDAHRESRGGGQSPGPGQRGRQLSRQCSQCVFY